MKKESIIIKSRKNQKGITLVALVVTIVVLIILATISIQAVFSDSGIIKQAEKASDVQLNAEATDKTTMDSYEQLILNTIEKNVEIGDVMYGDVNGDGKVINKDITMLGQFLAGKRDLDRRQKKAADVNGDGKIDETDLNLMREYIIGNINKFPVEE